MVPLSLNMFTCCKIEYMNIYMNVMILLCSLKYENVYGKQKDTNKVYTLFLTKVSHCTSFVYSMNVSEFFSM